MEVASKRMFLAGKKKLRSVFRGLSLYCWKAARAPLGQLAAPPSTHVRQDCAHDGLGVCFQLQPSVKKHTSLLRNVSCRVHLQLTCTKRIYCSETFFRLICELSKGNAKRKQAEQTVGCQENVLS